MSRLLLTLFLLLSLLTGGVAADDKEKKDKDSPKPSPVVITKVDAKKGEITVKYTDAKGKEQEKTFQLSKDVRIFDETGRVATIDVFQAGHDALVLESEGKLREVRRSVRPHPGRRLSDAMKTLIEMTDSDEVYAQEVQRIYDMLRKLDTAKNGKIDPAALKAERDRILEERIDDLIKRLDANKDGKISKDEAKGLVKEHFDKLDLNKDGFLDRDELLKAAREKQETKPSQSENK
jgi:Ca2+-binding EF-hand superfamily protein